MSHISKTGVSPSSTPSQKDPTIEKVETIPVMEMTLTVSKQVFSQLDNRIAIDQMHWTVTLVIDEASPISFHTRILTEGIDEQGPFFRISHFQGPTVIKNPKLVCNSWFCFGKIGSVQPGKRVDLASLRLHKYRLKSETWSRPSERVKAMLDQIDNEAKEENKEKNPTPFSFFGDKSLLTFTMELYEIKDQELLEIKETQPKKFEFLLDLYKKNREKNQIFALSLITHPRTWKIDKSDKKFWVDQCQSSNKKLNICFLLGLIFMKFLLFPKVRQLVERVFLIYEINKEKKLFDHFQKNVKIVKLTPNNCFTWARQKLRVLEIELSDHYSDRLISISSFYADKVITHDKM